MIGKNRLNNLKEKLMGANVGMGMLSNALKVMLPQLGDTLEKMEKPEQDGGMLKEGEQKVAFLIVHTSQGTMLTVNVLKKTDKGMLITRTISNQPIEKVFENDGDQS